MDEALGRRSEDGAVRRAQVVLVRRRTEGAQGAIHGEGIARERRGPPPRQDNLEDVARPDVLLRALDRGDEGRPGKRFFEGEGKERPGGRLTAPGERLLLERSQTGARGGFVAIPGARDEEKPVPDVIERDDRVEKPEPRVGHPDRIGVCIGQPFETPNGVVAHIADRAARERRQVVVAIRRSLVARERPESGKRVRLPAGDLARRRRAEERPPRHAISALHRFEQEARPAPREKPAHERDRSREIGRLLDDDEVIGRVHGFSRGGTFRRSASFTATSPGATPRAVRRTARW